jgi:hypothetical protein
MSEQTEEGHEMDRIDLLATASHRYGCRVLAFTITMLCVFQSLVSVAIAQPQPPSGVRMSEDEFRVRDLALRERAIDVEEKKATMSLWANGIPITLALLTLAGSIWAARRTVVAQFTTKAAELALQGEGPDEIINRAKLLAVLYKGLLPAESIKQLDELRPEQLGRIVTEAPWTSNLQKEVVTLLAQHPNQRDQIIADYISMFPDYEFLRTLPTGATGSTETTLPQKT